jgi:hypothetical protein
VSHRLRLLNGLYPAKLPSWRQAFFLFIGAAFLLQTYVAQTHIHPLAPPASLTKFVSFDPDTSASKTDQRLPARDRLPANDDPAKCPLCQAVGHAGQFVWPHAAVFILPQLPATIVPAVTAILRIPEPQSHDWQGRAPPRL